MSFWLQKNKTKQNKNKKQKLTGIKLWFGYHVGPISLYSLKPQDFDKPHRQCVFGVKNMVLKKYPKISTGVKPGILSQCGAKIFALFKNHKILASKSRPWVFGVKKMVLMKNPKILTRAKPKITIRCKPDIFVLFKSPKIVTNKTGHGLLPSRFLWNNPRFWKVLKLGFGYDVGPISWYSLKTSRFRQATQAM